MNDATNAGKVILHNIGAISVKLETYFDALAKERGFGISYNEWVLLSHVIEHSGKNQKWYAENILKDKTTTMRVIDTLEKRGLILRVPDVHNRRQNLLRATEKGEALIGTTLSFVNGAVADLLRGIDRANLNAAVEVLERIGENMMSTAVDHKQIYGGNEWEKEE